MKVLVSWAITSERTSCYQVEKSWGTGMDMEGVVVEKGGKQEVFLVQARPIVKAAK